MRWELIHCGAVGSDIPSPRFGATTWACNGSLWLFSGRVIESEALLSDLWRFDVAAKTWSVQAAGGQWPAGRLSAAAWVEGSVLCMYGGTLGSQLLDDSWSFDARGNSWSQREGSNPSPGLRAGSVVWHDGERFARLFGGIGADQNGQITVLNDLWSYSSADGTWCRHGFEHGRLPSPRTSSSSCITADECWVYDGIPPLERHGRPVNDLWAFDKRAATAKQFWPLNEGDEGDGPPARLGATLFSDRDNQIYLFGGFGGRNYIGLLNDLWVFNPPSRQWSLVSDGERSKPWPSPRSSCCTWVDKDKRLWLFGGYGTNSTGDANEQLCDLWLLTP